MSILRDKNGRFLKGKAGGPGRPRKKVPIIIHQKTLELTESLIDDVMGEFESLTVSQKIEVLTKLMPFVLPRLSAVEGSFGITLDDLMGMTKEQRLEVMREYQKEHSENND